MSKFYFSLVLVLLISCKQEKSASIQKNKNETEIKIENWQEGFGLTHSVDVDSIWGNPVKYYLTNKDCDSTAIKFYFGKYKPIDEPETARLLNLATTDNDSLRSFYRWILNKTLLIQDGALGEYTGVPARKYAEKFPEEFFEYMDFDKSGEKYSNWVNSINYSGFYDSDNYKNSKNIKKNIEQAMLSNCKHCDTKTKKKIEKFAKDCFPETNNFEQ